MTSGAAEIGRLDYIRRTGHELTCDSVDAKTDYAAQGQTILMEQYRHFIRQEYGVRQVLVEHQHFNDPGKRESTSGGLFLRAKEQGAIPIVNYNDPVSDAENRKWELSALRRENREVHECVDNDETAAVIAGLISTRVLLIMTSTEGIYADPNDPATLVREVTAHDAQELEARVRKLQEHCVGGVARGGGRRVCQARVCARSGAARHDGDHRAMAATASAISLRDAFPARALASNEERRTMKANYHTHTARCGHAEGTDEAYVRAAIAQGFEELGFSDQVPWPYRSGYTHPRVRMHIDRLDEYVSSIRALADRYADQIRVRVGFECEHFPEYIWAGWPIWRRKSSSIT